MGSLASVLWDVLFIFRLLPLFNALGLLHTKCLEDGVPTLCFLGVTPELAPW